MNKLKQGYLAPGYSPQEWPNTNMVKETMYTFVCILIGDSCVTIYRYSQEQSFTSLPLEIRNHQNLRESLEQYVKGDLLEGANAYYCERCGKKVGKHCVPPVIEL